MTRPPQRADPRREQVNVIIGNIATVRWGVDRGVAIGISDRIVVLGYGLVGKGVVAELVGRGTEVVVGQRTEPADLPGGARFMRTDVLDTVSVTDVCRAATQVVAAFGFEDRGSVWQRKWPVAMEAVLTGCEPSGARLIFFDNLYMYGSQSGPLHEDLALTATGAKPSVRLVITRRWRDAHGSGRARTLALRASDFYSPGVQASHIGNDVMRAIAAGKPASFVAPLDVAHDFAYVPDIHRAFLSMLDAPDDAFGKAWHVPCAPTETIRAIALRAARAFGKPLKTNVVPLWSLPLLGIFVPFLKEMAEMRFQWDRPHRVGASRFANRFWGDATSFDDGVRATDEAHLASASR